MGIRKSFVELDATERDNFLKAVLTLKNEIVNPMAPSAEQVSIYDQFVAIHRSVMSLTLPDGSTRNFGHTNSMFLPWHRLYIKEFEAELQKVDASVNLPFWDWTERAKTGSELFQNSFIGPTTSSTTFVPNPQQTRLNVITDGYFAQASPDPTPAWWPQGLNGWTIRRELQPYYNSLPNGEGESQDLRESLVRLGGRISDLPSLSEMNRVLQSGDYHSFRLALEAGIIGGPIGLPTHNFGHNWVGGHMGTETSPNDPIFFMHHCFVDKIWHDWQADGHQDDYAGRSPFGLNDPMWPWVTNPDDYDSPAQVKPLLPDYEIDEDFTPADVLDISAPSLDYSYE